MIKMVRIDNIKVKFILEKKLIDQDGFVCYRTPVRFHTLELILKDGSTVLVAGDTVEYMSLNYSSFLIQVKGESVTGYFIDDIEELVLEN